MNFERLTIYLCSKIDFYDDWRINPKFCIIKKIKVYPLNIFKPTDI